MDDLAPEQPIISPPSPKTSRGFRIFFRLLIFIFILLISAIGAGVIIGVYYQDEVKEYIVSQLNKQLNTEILIDGKDIDFTVLKNFPNASLDFKNIKALDAIKSGKKDTLFRAGEISLQFNIVDVFNKNYRIKKLEIGNAHLKIRIDKSGNDNYHFWKTTSDTATSNFKFDLEEIILKQVQFSFKNYKTKQNYDVLIRRSNLSGNFSEKKYEVESTADLFVNYIKSENVNLISDKDVHTEVILMVDNDIPSYKIKKGKIKIENLLFDIMGNIIDANNEPIFNLAIKGKELDVKSFLSLIPEKYKGKINDYKSNGEFYFDATIQGSFSNNQVPTIVADFGIKNANISQVKDNIVLKNVNLKGHYSNGNKEKSHPSELSLIPFSAIIGDGSLVGELTLRNLDNPSFDATIKANLRLNEVQKFFRLDTIETITGRIKIDASFNGEGKNIHTQNYENINTSGNLEITNMNLKLKNNSLNFMEINGSFNFDNNDLNVNSLTGLIATSDFDLKGSFKNMMSYLLKQNQDVMVDATLNSKNINLGDFLENNVETGNNSAGKYKLSFSEHINVNLNSEIQHLVFRSFEATNIKGIIKIKDKKLIADPITLSTMGGTIITNGYIDGTDSTKLIVTCFSEMERINISKLFYSFENFGQTAVTNKNINGIATAKINFAAELSPELKIDMDKLYAGVDMTIDNGELNNVESMKSLSRFIELKDLESVHFSTLKNQIEIKNQVINIPKMEVKSNTINIIASGTHTFNNEINYKVKLSLNELLSKKAKKAKKENDEFGEIADDGLGRTNIFLAMTGTLANPIIKYDSKSAIQNVKNDIKVEKQTLKAILKDEFGLFKKDSTLTKKSKTTEDTKFKIQWEEADKKEEKKELKKPKKEESDDFE